MKEEFLLDAVVGQGPSILQLLAATKYETLLLWRDTLLVMNLGLDVMNSIYTLDIKNNAPASVGLNNDLHLKRAHQASLILDKRLLHADYYSIRNSIRY